MTRQKLLISTIIILALFWLGCGSRNVKKAQEYMAVEMYDQAIKLLELELQASPKNAEAHYQLGIAYLCVGNTYKAKEAFDRSIILKTAYKDKLGIAYLSAGMKLLTKEPSRAETYFTQAKEKDPALANQIALLFYEKGAELVKTASPDSPEFGKSLELLRKSVEFDPASREKVADFCFASAKAYLEKGFEYAACWYAQLSIEIDPKHIQEVKADPRLNAPPGMVYIPAGEFLMGSPEGEGFDNEHPQHKVYLDAYFIDIYEVTNEQFAKFVDATGYQAEGDWREYFTSKHPVVDVTWNDANAYCRWAGKRLPTEAEWEKAARGADGRRYPWGNEWDSSKCNSSGDSDGYEGTAPVGSFPAGASPYDVMDMAGNAWEWCADWYDDDYYSRSPQQNPQGSDSRSQRVLRGGSWGDPPGYARAATRLSYYSGYRLYYIGFRGVALRFPH